MGKGISNYICNEFDDFTIDIAFFRLVEHVIKFVEDLSLIRTLSRDVGSC